MNSGVVAHIDPRNSRSGYLVPAGTVLSIGLALSEPSASSGLGLTARLVFWLAHVASALFFFEAAQIGLGRFAVSERLPPFLLVTAVGVIGAVLFSIFNLLFLDRIAFLIGEVTDPEPISMAGLLEEMRDSGAISVLFWVLLNSPRLIMIAQQSDADAAIGATQRPISLAPAKAAIEEVRPRQQLLDLLSRPQAWHYQSSASTVPLCAPCGRMA